MKFDEVVLDIKKMVGVKISSIRAGADITLSEVNVRESRIELVDAKNNHRSRSLPELRRVWTELCQHKAVHVDSVLGGSGSSRNQPETILANLPYVEWLILNGRKHISFVGKPTHALGTLKTMDSLSVHALRSASEVAKSVIPSVIIVAENIRSVSSCIEGISGIPPVADTIGVYAHNFTDREIVVVNSFSMAQPLPAGVYVVITAKAPPSGSRPITIANADYNLVIRDGVSLLVFVL
jgi:hypothetical protein